MSDLLGSAREHCLKEGNGKYTEAVEEKSKSFHGIKSSHNVLKNNGIDRMSWDSINVSNYNLYPFILSSPSENPDAYAISHYHRVPISHYHRVPVGFGKDLNLEHCYQGLEKY